MSEYKSNIMIGQNTNTEEFYKTMLDSCKEMADVYRASGNDKMLSKTKSKIEWYYQQYTYAVNHDKVMAISKCKNR